MAEDNSARAIPGKLRRGKEASDLWLHAQSLEEIRRNVDPHQPFGLAASGKLSGSEAEEGVISGQVLKASTVPLILLEYGHRIGAAAESIALRNLHPHELARIR